ncbi:MAG TPA: hypothetical protein VM198_03000 [Longimicrobiales bacterium]|nr:hypothetical protein [Longimicrobiales bacterium]
MEELIFFAVIIFFTIVESIARRRKQRSAGSPQIPEEWEQEEQGREWRSETDEVEAPRRSGSEAMIPGDIWEEIAGLARERTRQPETQPEVPPPPPVQATPPVTLPARLGWGKRTPKVGQPHRVHLSHAEYGTDPSSRTQSRHDQIDPLARGLSADVKAVRKQLRHGRHALRQAVILQEVLGPPVSIRPEGFRQE